MSGNVISNEGKRASPSKKIGFDTINHLDMGSKFLSVTGWKACPPSKNLRFLIEYFRNEFSLYGNKAGFNSTA